MWGEVSALGAALAWAVGSLVFERVARGRVSAVSANLGKSLVGLVALLVIRAAVGGQRVSGADAAQLAASGIIGIAVGDTAFFVALSELGSAKAILLLSTAPLFVEVYEALRFGRVPDAREGLGVILTLVGVGVVVLRDDERSGQLRKGVAAGFVSGVCQATGALLAREATQERVSVWTAAPLRLAAGVVGLSVALLAAGRIRQVQRELAQKGLMVKIAAASLIGTVLGLLLSQVAVAKSRSIGVASTLLSTSPLFALPLAHIAGIDRATPRAVAGAAVAVCGVALLFG